jgi:predicted transcriptional regulator
MKKTNLPTIRQALEFRMEQYGHSQNKAAKVMKISQTHFNEVMKGRHSPSVSQLKAFYRYGIPPEVLLR